MDVTPLDAPLAATVRGWDPSRPLTDDEAHQVVVLRNSPAVARILAEAAELTSAPKVNASELERVFEQPSLPAQVTKDQSWTIPHQVQTPSTGQASTTIAPPAVQDRGVSQEPSVVKAPATASHPPIQATKTVLEAVAGGAITANTEPSQGFGSTVPVTEESPTSPQPATDPFETGLDEMMAKLLPAGPR